MVLAPELPIITRTRNKFCQDFSKEFAPPKEFDRKFQGEILKIEGRNLEDFHPKFAVRLQPLLNLLIINLLQNSLVFGDFVKYFYQFLPTSLPLFSAPPTDCRLGGKKAKNRENHSALNRRPDSRAPELQCSRKDKQTRNLRRTPLADRVKNAKS